MIRKTKHDINFLNVPGGTFEEKVTYVTEWIREEIEEDLFKEIYEMAKGTNMKELSLKKYQWIIDKWDYSKDYYYNQDKMLEDIPALKHLKNHCPYCDKYECIECPLHEKDAVLCCHDYGLWLVAVLDIKPVFAKVCAKKMYERIRNYE